MAILVQSNKKPSVSFPSQTGAIITFNSQYAGLPLKSCKVNIPVTQEGTGDPSPDNVRTINGYSAINISHSDADTSNPTVHTIQIGSTVYGGEYDARTGVLTAPVNGADMGSLTWSIQDVSGDVTRFISNPIADMKLTTTRTMNIICSMFKTNKSIPEPYMDNSIYNGANVKQLIVVTSDYSDLASFTSAVNGQAVVYELATPQTIQLPPCPIDTLQGVNNIWADTGDTTVQYIKIGG